LVQNTMADNVCFIVLDIDKKAEIRYRIRPRGLLWNAPNYTWRDWWAHARVWVFRWWLQNRSKSKQRSYVGMLVLFWLIVNDYGHLTILNIQPILCLSHSVSYPMRRS
jgi:hypothetical protein